MQRRAADGCCPSRILEPTLLTSNGVTSRLCFSFQRTLRPGQLAFVSLRRARPVEPRAGATFGYWKMRHMKKTDVVCFFLHCWDACTGRQRMRQDRHKVPRGTGPDPPSQLDVMVLIRKFPRTAKSFMRRRRRLERCYVYYIGLLDLSVAVDCPYIWGRLGRGQPAIVAIYWIAHPSPYISQACNPEQIPLIPRLLPGLSSRRVPRLPSGLISQMGSRQAPGYMPRPTTCSATSISSSAQQKGNVLPTQYVGAASFDSRWWRRPTHLQVVC